MDIKHYSYRVIWSQEDQEHIGLCAEFPSLSWLDKDPRKALDGIMNIVNETVHDMQENGEPLPVILSEKNYSGKFSVRVPPIVHYHLAIEAAEQGVSMNRIVNFHLTK